MNKKKVIGQISWRCDITQLFKEVLINPECSSLSKPLQITLHLLAGYVKPAMEEKNILCLQLLADLGILVNGEYPDDEHGNKDIRAFVSRDAVLGFCKKESKEEE